MTQSNDAERFYEEILRKDYCKQLGLVADRHIRYRSYSLKCLMFLATGGF